VQIDNNGTFTSPEQDVIVGVGPTSYIASDLADGKYSWRVRALNSDDAPGPWSTKRTFTVDTMAPPAPVLIAPLDGASSTNTKLALSWGAVSGAARTSSRSTARDLPLPVIDVGTARTYQPPRRSRAHVPLARARGG